MEAHPLNIIMIILITIVIIGISLAMILYIGFDISRTIPIGIEQTYERFIRIIFSVSPYNLCEAYSNKELSLQDFQTLLIAAYNGQCEDKHAVVTLSFSLSKNEIRELAELTGIADKGKLIFYNISEPIGTGGLIINGNPGNFPLKLWDTVEIWTDGKPKADVIINVTIQGCDPYDDDCDISCVYKKGICDPNCYKNGKKFDIPCDIDCVDVNKNGAIDSDDFDNICSFDCYNNRTDPDRAYDPDCILFEHFKQEPKQVPDGLCDPDSNGAIDGLCDPDCAKTNFICDFDCNGTVRFGNPKGLKDDDCYVCDKTCNGFCSPVCTRKDNDLDCPKGFKDWELTECCGNAKCSIGEDCYNCPADCPGPTSETTCENFKKVCCPQASDDEYGCSSVKELEETDFCSCDTQCKEGLNCTAGRCCPQNKFWNGTYCTENFELLIVALKNNMKKVYSDQQIVSLENKVKEYLNALAFDGLAGTLLFLDEDQTSSLIGSKVINTGSWQEIDRILDQIIPKFKVKYIIILGGYSRFPQAEFDPHGCPDDSFSTFQTDDIYGDYEPKDNFPDIPVGRIPDPNNGDINVLLSALDTYISLHKSGGLDISDYYSAVMEKTYVYGACAYELGGPCFNKHAMSVNCFSSKCVRAASASYTSLSGHKFVMIMGHGIYTPGQFITNDMCDGYSLFMSSYNIPNLDVKNSVWMLMACYGGFIKDMKNTEDSNIMQFLKNGGAVYFGGTLTQFTSATIPLDCDAFGVPGGDAVIGTLYALIVKEFSINKRIGDSFIQGKFKYGTTIPDEGSCRFRVGHQTLLYGDPTLKIKNM